MLNTGLATFSLVMAIVAFYAASERADLMTAVTWLAGSVVCLAISLLITLIFVLPDLAKFRRSRDR